MLSMCSGIKHIDTRDAFYFIINVSSEFDNFSPNVTLSKFIWPTKVLSRSDNVFLLIVKWLLNRFKEKCQNFSFDRSSYYQAPGRVETGFRGEAWQSIDMKVGLFCGNGPQMSALLISMSKIGAVIGGLLAGTLPFRYGIQSSAILRHFNQGFSS